MSFFLAKPFCRSFSVGRCAGPWWYQSLWHYVLASLATQRAKRDSDPSVQQSDMGLPQGACGRMNFLKCYTVSKRERNTAKWLPCCIGDFFQPDRPGIMLKSVGAMDCAA